MAKQRSKWNERTYNRYIAEGRGQGNLESYKPWIRIQDFASRGVVSRIKSNKTNRIIHLMSKNELYYFYLLEWADHVLDIREQFPLIDVEMTTTIAKKIGVKHPIDNESGFPYVLTCDFLITMSDRTIARTIKQSSELSNKRTLEKLEIERRFWQDKGVDWGIVTEHEISNQKAKNIEWIYFADNISDMCLGAMERAELCFEIQEEFYGSEAPITDITTRIEAKHGLEPGIALRLFKYLVRMKKINIPMEEVLQLSAIRRKDTQRQCMI